MVLLNLVHNSNCDFTKIEMLFKFDKFEVLVYRDLKCKIFLIGWLQALQISISINIFRGN